MKFPIVKTTTQDGYLLHGLFIEPTNSTNNIIIHIHGSGGNFYWNTFHQYYAEMANILQYSYLSVNTRGADVYNTETGSNSTGSAVEIFEESIFDINSWIEWIILKGYKNIILSGHSFGTNKIQYYALNGEYKKKIKALILLGFTDSYGGQLEYLKKNNLKNEDFLNESEKLIHEGNPLQLLSNPHVNWGELPQTAQSYLNFMSPNSALSKILPLGTTQKLENFQKINIPILGIVGDTNECTVIPPNKAVVLMNNQNINAQCYMLEKCTHGYKGKEKEVIEKIKKFIMYL